MAVNIGPRIGIDNEPEFRKQLNNIIQQCKTLDSEMKSVTSSFDANDQSQEKLTQQSEVLTKQIQAQTQRLEMLQKGLTESANKYGEADTKTQKWQQAVNEATTSLNRMQRQLDDINSAMETNAYDDLTRQIEEQEAEVKRLRTAYQNAVLEFGDASDEAEQLGRELSDASSELKQSRAAMKSASDAADELDNSLDDAADSADDLDNSFSSIQDIIGGNVIANGISEIAGSIKDMYEESIEFMRIMASLEVSSQQFGYSSEQTAESFSKLIGVLGDTQTAATTLSNLQAIGLEQSDLNELIDDAVGAWSRYGDSMPIDSLAESVNETIKTRTVTGTFADVLNWATGEEDSFNEALASTKDQSEAARIVLDKLSELDLSQMGKDWQENNEELIKYNQSQFELQQALADFSKNFAPIISEISSYFADFLGDISEFFSVISENEKTLTIFTESIKTIANFLSGKGVGAGVDMATDSLTGNTDFLAYVAEQQAQVAEQTDKVTESVSNMGEQVTATKDTVTSDMSLEAQAFGNMSIEAQNMAVEVNNAVLGIQQSVQDYLSQTGQIFQEFSAGTTLSTQELLNNFQSQVDGVKTWEENLTTLMSTVKETSDGVSVSLDEGLIQYLANMGPEGAGYVQTFVNMSGDELAKANQLWSEKMDIEGFTNNEGQYLTTGIQQMAAGGALELGNLKAQFHSEMIAVGGDLNTGLIEGVQQTIADVATAGTETGDQYTEALKTATQVHSPSEVTKEVGRNLTQGLINGIKENATAVRNSGKEIAREALFGLRAVSVSDFQNVGINLAQGLASGISAGRSSVINASVSLAQSAISAARATLDINSPSKVFREIGQYTSEGFLVGMEDIDLKKEVSRIMDFQQQHVNAVMSLQYQNVDEIYSVVYSAVKAGMKQVNDRDKRYMDILDNMSKRPVVTQNYMDGRPIGYGVAPYVTTRQQQQEKIKNWVNGVK